MYIFPYLTPDVFLHMGSGGFVKMYTPCTVSKLTFYSMTVESYCTLGLLVHLVV